MKISKPFLKQLAMYAAVGALAMAIELSLLSLLISVFHIYYLAASAMVSIVSLTSSFLLRKFWVFKDQEQKNLARQIALYIGTLVGVVSLNTFLVSRLVEVIGLLPVVAQFSASIFSGFLGFLVNRNITFGQNKKGERSY